MGGEGYINHPDHRAVGMAAVDAVFPAAGQPHLFQELRGEGLEAHKVRKVYSMNWAKVVRRQPLSISQTQLISRSLHCKNMSANSTNGTQPRWSSSGLPGGQGQRDELRRAYRVVTLVGDEDWEKLHVDPKKAAA
ncbi:MAG: hypothetical protein R2932_40260 [Caldilineaceae bacterium]